MNIPWHRTRITHLSRKGQLTIPVVIIRQLGLIPGRTRFRLDLKAKTLRLLPMEPDS
jgi:hypothetical protein